MKIILLPLMLASVCGLAACKGLTAVKNTAGDFAVTSIAPPFAKLTTTVLQPIAGRETVKRLQSKTIGKFEGEPRIVPIAPNLFWFFQPDDPAERFRFVTHQFSPYEGEKTWVIEPGSMFFDGASVPRAVWQAKSYGPFDFSKSALIHDWLFEAHHRAEIYKWAVSRPDLPPSLHAEMEAGYHRWSAFSEDADTKATDTRGNPRPVTKGGLSLETSADIIAECIWHEMEISEAATKLVTNTIAVEKKKQEDARAKGKESSLIGNTVQGLDEINKALAISKKDPSVVGIYRWAVGSSLARKVWNPETGHDLSTEHSRHRSTLTTLQALLDNHANNNAVKEDVITAWLRDQFRGANDTRMGSFNEFRKASDTMQKAMDIVLTAPKLAPASARSKVISATLPADVASTASESLLRSTAAAFGATFTEARRVSRSPQKIEVRYYRYPEDREGAQKILAALQKAGLSGGRISFVIDRSQITDPSVSRYQIALSQAAVTQLQATHAP